MIFIQLLSLQLIFYMKLSDGLPCGCANNAPPPRCNHDFAPVEPKTCNHNLDHDDNKCMEENYRPFNDNHVENIPKPGSQCSHEVNNRGEHIENGEGCNCGRRDIKEEPIQTERCDHENANTVEKRNNPIVKPRCEQNSHSQFEGEVTGVNVLHDDGKPEGDQNACGCGRLNEKGEPVRCDRHDNENDNERTNHEVIIPHHDNDKNVGCEEIGKDLDEHNHREIDDKGDRNRHDNHADDRNHEDRDKNEAVAIPQHRTPSDHNDDVNTCGCGRVNDKGELIRCDEHDHDDRDKIREPVVIKSHDDIGHLDHVDDCGTVNERRNQNDHDDDHNLRRDNKPVVISKHIDNGHTLSEQGDNDENHGLRERTLADRDEHEIGNECVCGKLNENNERADCNQHGRDDDHGKQSGKPVVITKHEHHGHRRVKPAVQEGNCGCGKVGDKREAIKCENQNDHDNHDVPVVITKHEVNECPTGGHEDHTNDLNQCGCGRNDEKINAETHDDGRRIQREHEPTIIIRKEDNDHNGNEHEDVNKNRDERHDNDVDHGIQDEHGLVIKRIDDGHRDDEHGDHDRVLNQCGSGKTNGRIITEKHDDDSHGIERDHQPTVIIKREDNDHTGIGHDEHDRDKTRSERQDNNDNHRIRDEHDILMNKRIDDDHREDDHVDHNRDLNECGREGINTEKHDIDDSHKIQRDHTPTVIIRKEDNDQEGNEHGENDREKNRGERHDNHDNHGIQDEHDLVNKRIDDGHRDDEHGNHNRDLNEGRCGGINTERYDNDDSHKIQKDHEPTVIIKREDTDHLNDEHDDHDREKNRRESCDKRDNHGIQDEHDLVNKRIEDGHRDDERGNHNRDLNEGGYVGINTERHDNVDSHRIQKDHAPTVIIKKEDNDHEGNEHGENDRETNRNDRHDNIDNHGIGDEHDLQINKQIDDGHKEDDHTDHNRDLKKCGCEGINTEKHDNDDSHKIQRDHSPTVIIKNEDNDHIGNEHGENDRENNRDERHDNHDNHGIQDEHDLVNKRIDDGHKDDEHGNHNRDLNEGGCGGINTERHDNDDSHRIRKGDAPTVIIKKEGNDRLGNEHGENDTEKNKSDNNDHNDNHGIRDEHDLLINKRIDDGHRDDEQGNHNRDLDKGGCGRINTERHDNDDSHRIQNDHEPTVIINKNDNDHRDGEHERNLNDCNCGKVDERGENVKCDRHDDDNNHRTQGDQDLLINKRLDDAHNHHNTGAIKTGKHGDDDSLKTRREHTPRIITKNDDHPHRGNENEINRCENGDHGVHGQDVDKHIDVEHKADEHDEHGDHDRGLNNCQCGRIDERGQTINCSQHDNNAPALLERKDNDDVLKQADHGRVDDDLHKDDLNDHRIGDHDENRVLQQTHGKDGGDCGCGRIYNNGDVLKREDHNRNDIHEPVIVNGQEGDRQNVACARSNDNKHNNCGDRDQHGPLIINKDDNNRHTECDHRVNNNALQPCACGLSNDNQCGCEKSDRIAGPIKGESLNNNDDHRLQNGHEAVIENKGYDNGLRSSGCRCGRTDNKQDSLCPVCGNKNGQATSGCNCGRQ